MSSERRVAIRMRELTKAYAIYAHPRDRLKQYLWPGKRKFYSEMLAVRGISLDVHAGELLVEPRQPLHQARRRHVDLLEATLAEPRKVVVEGATFQKSRDQCWWTNPGYHNQ